MKYTIQQFHKDFPDNDTCLQYLFEQRFSDAVCEHCGKKEFYKHPKRACYSCSCGKTHLFPKNETIFEKSSTDLVKWFYAIFLMSQSRNGVAAKEIERHVGVTYKCAWRMTKQIRSLMSEDTGLLQGTVQADETMIGGKTSFKKRSEKPLVFGAVEEQGKAKLEIIKGTNAQAISDAVQSSVAKSSTLHTDGLHAYRKSAKLLGVKHDRTKKTNMIEGLFSQLKRSLDGTYHVISPKYLPLYLQEFQFRYNHGRNSVHLFDALMARL